MVSIFTGAGAGFERGSGSVLGGMGLIGASSQGRSGEQLFLNAANGNLLISQRDEYLVGRGPDAEISRTYNSLGGFDGDNGDNWRQNTTRRVHGLTGALGSAGSSVKRVSADGSEITYTWNGSAYVATDGAGAYDKLVRFSGGWTWTDGEGRITETYADYDGQARITEQVDTSGNRLTFSYSADKLSRVTTADGGYVEYRWTGSNISQIVTGYTDLASGAAKTLTRTRYAYDGHNRLSSVTVDLSPEDGTTADGRTYTTSYTYHGASKLVASIRETDGSRLDIGYDGANRVVSLAEAVAAGVVRTTNIAYGAGYTNITDPAGQVTTLEYHGDGSLRRIVAPPASAGVAAQAVSFAYSPTGDLASVTDAAGNVTSYAYDERGNTTRQTDRLGNVVTRTYGARNELLTETRTGSDASSAAAPHTTRFIYDGANRLRFQVSAEGNVTQFHHDGHGQLRYAVEYPDQRYDVSALAPTEPLYEHQLAGWHDRIPDKSTIKVLETRYDARGNVAERVSFGAASVQGHALTDNGYTHEFFTYDQAGQLLSRSHASVPSGSPPSAPGQTNSFLGRFGGTGGAEAVSKTFILNPALNRTSIRFDFLKLDSWDGEQLTVYLNGDAAFSFAPEAWDRGRDGAGGQFSVGGITGTYSVTSAGEDQQLGGSPDWSDRAYLVRIELDNAGSSVRLGVGASIDQWIEDESYGIDNVRVEQPAFVDDFENGSPAGWTVYGSPSGVHEAVSARDGGTSRFIGRFGGTAGAEAVSKTYTLNPASAATSVEFDLLKFDSWDSEQFNLFVNGALAFTFTPEGFGPGSDTASGTFTAGPLTGRYTITSANIDQELGFVGGWGDRPYHVRLELAGAASSMRLGFGSNLNEDVGNESFGIDNVRVAQSPLVDDFESGPSSGWVFNANAPVSEKNGGITRQVGRLTGSGGAERVSKTFALNPAISRTSVEFDFNKIDSWDGYDVDGSPGAEQVTLYVNGVAALNFMPWAYGQGSNGASGTFSAGGVTGSYQISSTGRDEWLGFNGEHSDRVYRFRLDIDGAGASLRIGLGASIDGVSVEDESYGIDNVRVSQADQIDNFENGSPSGWIVTGGPNFTAAAWVAEPASGPDGGFSRFLGRFSGTGGGEAVSKTYSLNRALSHTTAEFDFLKLDSWDSYEQESLTVFLNGAAAFTFMPEGFGEGGRDGASGSFAVAGLTGSYRITSSGDDRSLGFAGFGDRVYRVVIELDGAGGSLKLGVGTNLTQGLDDEAWGIDNVRVAQSAALATLSFEQPEVGTGYQYQPQVAGVSFGPNSGVAGNGSAWGFAPAPTGDQVAFLRSSPEATGSITHTVTGLTPGAWYAVSLLAAQRPGYANNPVTVRVNSAVLGTFAPESSAFQQFTTIWYQASHSWATIELTGTPSGVDAGIAVDNVQLLHTAQFDNFETGSTSGWVLNNGAAPVSSMAAAPGPVVSNRETFVYDGMGRVIASTDLNGGATSIVFHDSSTQTVVTLANGLVQTSTYNKSGELVSFTESGDYMAGGTATYRYDQLGRLRMTTDATGRSTYHLYDKAGRKVADINHQGHVIEYRYDPNDRLVASVRYAEPMNGVHFGALADPNSGIEMASIRPPQHSADIWTWQVYDKEGRLLQSIDGAGGVTCHEYDGSGRLTLTTIHANRLAQWQVDGFKSAAPGAPVLPPHSEKDSIARNFYDDDGRLIGVLDGEGYLSRTVYDAAGQKIQEIGYVNPTAHHLRSSGTFEQLAASAGVHPNDRQSRYVYDGQGLLRFSIDGLNQVTEYGYQSGATWTSSGPVRQTTRYAGSIRQLDTYTYPSVRAEINAAGLAANGNSRINYGVYDASDRLAFSVGAEGAVVGYVYDEMGQVAKVVEYATIRPTTSLPSLEDMHRWAHANNGHGENRATRNYYSDRGELRFTVDAEGYVTRNDHDAEGRVIRTARFDRAIHVDDRSTMADVNAAATGHWAETTFAYDAGGRIAFTFDGEGNNRHYVYSANGTLAWEIAAWGHPDQSTTHYLYDAAGRLATELRAWDTPELTRTDYVYDGLGNLVEIVDPNQNRTHRSYDKLGRMISQRNAENGEVRTEYNAFGEATTVTDARGHSSYMYYDKLGRMIAARDAENYVTETRYNAFGEVASITRRQHQTGSPVRDYPAVPNHHLDATTSFEYDRLGRVVKTTDAENHVEQYTLNAFGERTQVRNKIGGLTHSRYDRRGLLVEELLPMASVRNDASVQADRVANRFEYDARGNRTRMIEAAGLAEQRITSYVYDRADRLIETRGNPVVALDQHSYTSHVLKTPTERFRYDARGNLIETIDANDARTLLYYDDLNRKIGEISPTGTLSCFAYDKNGNVILVRVHGVQIAQPSSAGGAPPMHPPGETRETTYTYDRLNRLKTSTLVQVRTGRWDGANYQAWIGDLTTSYDYDANGNIVRTIDANGGTVFTYYDRLNRKFDQVDQEMHATSWRYDAEGNVVHERRWANKVPYAGLDTWHWPPFSAADRVTDFGYDRNGRRTVEVRRGVEAYNTNGWGGLDRTTSDAEIRYEYNGLGQVTRKVEATAWNAENVDQHQILYTYDGAGRLVSEARSWYLDHEGHWTRPVVDYSYDGLNNLTRTRQYGHRTAPLQGERITRYQYREGGRLQHMWDPEGAQFNYYQDTAGNLVAQTWDRRRSDESVTHEGVLYTRDVLGRVTSQALGTWTGQWIKGDVQQTAYNAYGEMSARGLNDMWQEKFGYDRAGRLERTNQGDGVWRYFVYDGNGNQTLAIENEGDADLVDRSTDHALWRARNYDQTHAGNVFIDGLNTTINIYDRRNQAVESQLRHRELDAARRENLSVGRGYNAFGEVVWERDARGSHTHFDHNTMGRLIKLERATVFVVNEDGNGNWVRPTERYFYDLSGRMVGTEDANRNRNTRALLNGTGYGGTEALVLREHHADGGVIRNGYDMYGDLRRSTDEIGRVTDRIYDGLGRLTQVARPNGLVQNYRYDIRGQRTQHWNNQLGAGDVERTDYDVQGRVTSVRAFGGDTTTTSYSWNGGLGTQGMGIFGGWTQITTYQNGRRMTESSDMFGRDLWKGDLGGNVFEFRYDLGGRLREHQNMNAVGGDRLTYQVFNTGLVSSVTNAAGDQATYGYDETGNKIAERTVRGGRVVQNAAASYDALGRMFEFYDPGSDTTPVASLRYRYDANGNVRSTEAVYQQFNGDGSIGWDQRTYWNRYDSMNRVVLDKGELVNGRIVRGANGISYEYDAAGQRAVQTKQASLSQGVWQRTYNGQITYWSYRANLSGTWTFVNQSYTGDRRESFTYNGDGTIDQVFAAESRLVFADGSTSMAVGDPGPASLISDYSFDLMGRLTRQIDYQRNGAVGYDRILRYNLQGQVQSEDVVSRQGNDTLASYVTYGYYTSSGEYALGSVVTARSRNLKNGRDADAPDTLTTNSYIWRDGAMTSRVDFRPDLASGTTHTSTFSYDAWGALTSVRINDGRPRTVFYTNNMNGQVIRREEQDGNYNTPDPREFWHRFNGKQLGYVGNNGTLETMDYRSSIDSRTQAVPTGTSGAFRGGASYGTGHADFSQSVDPINSYNPGSMGGSYTVEAGDTLASIAAALWGDANLWYKLAEANGMTAQAMLVEGQRLIIPAGVIKSGHNAATFRPYDPSGAIGDVSPTTPRPQQARGNKCGVFGQILLVAVAVAVTALTYGALTGPATGVLGAIGAGAVSGAAGSIASQAVGVATGIQDRFSWKGVALSAISGGVSGGLTAAFPGGGIAGAAARGAAGSAITQGLAVVTGLQPKFSWAGVAAAGVTAGVGHWAVGRLASAHVGPNATRLLAQTAGAIAGAATQSVLDGSDFGDNILAALPGVVGSTIGNMIAAPILARQAAATERQAANARAQALQTEARRKLDELIPPERQEAYAKAGVRFVPGRDGMIRVEGLNDERVRAALASDPRVKFGPDRPIGGAGIRYDFLDTQPDAELQPGMADLGGINFYFDDAAGGIQSDYLVYEGSGALRFFSRGDSSYLYTGGERSFPEFGLRVSFGPQERPILPNIDQTAAMHAFTGDRFSLGAYYSNLFQSQTWRYDTAQSYSGQVVTNIPVRLPGQMTPLELRTHMDRLTGGSTFSSLFYSTGFNLGADQRTLNLLHGVGSSIGGFVAARGAASRAYIPTAPAPGGPTSVLTRADGNFYWPPHNGVAGGYSKPVVLPAGTLLSRRGDEAGGFLAPLGTPVGMRSLDPISRAMPENVYRVERPLVVNAGTAWPAFGQPGGGWQYQLQGMSVGDARAGSNPYLTRVGP